MFWTRLLISVAEFALSLGLSIFIVFWSYKSFARMNADAFDAEAEIERGNTAVAVLMGSLTFAAALVMKQSIYPVISIVQMGLTGGSLTGGDILLFVAYAAGQLLLGFLLSVGTVEVALRLFSRLNRELDEHAEIARGNTAVAVIMGAVVLIVALFMQQGVGAVGKALIPQPRLGALRMMD